MTVNPDDLLIFKVRTQSGNKAAGAQTVVIEAAKPQAAQPPQPAQQQAQAAPKFNPPPQPVRQQEVQRAPTAQPAFDTVQQPVQPEKPQANPAPQPIVTPRPQEVQQRPIRQPQAAQPPQEAANAAAKRRGRQPKQEPQPEPPQPVRPQYTKPVAQPQAPPPEPQQEVQYIQPNQPEEIPVVAVPGQDYVPIQQVSGDIIDVAMSTMIGGGEQGGKKPPERKRSAKEMRRIAEHMSCENHPWRKAYAICDYCKRAFCYEDIVEHNGVYYCIDDIGNIPKSVLNAGMVKYSKLSYISAASLVLIAAVYVYFFNPQIAAMLAALKAAGAAKFAAKFTLAEGLLIVEGALALISIVTSILVLISAKRSFMATTVTQIATIGIFSYQYIVTLNIAYSVVAVLSFVALITLAYSRISYEPLPEENAELLSPTATLSSEKGPVF